VGKSGRFLGPNESEFELVLPVPEADEVDLVGMVHTGMYLLGWKYIRIEAHGDKNRPGHRQSR
jgi:hypothetical protein